MNLYSFCGGSLSCQPIIVGNQPKVNKQKNQLELMFFYAIMASVHINNIILMSESPNGATPGATPAPPSNGIPPAPGAPNPALSNGAIPETVTLTKEEHEKLLSEKARAEARAAEAQSRADKLSKSAGAPGKTLLGKAIPQPSAEELEAASSAEYQKALREVSLVSTDPEFREVLDSDQTLRTLMALNPEVVMQMYAPDAVDAQDVRTSLRTELSTRLEKIRQSKAPAPAPAPPTTPPTPNPNPAPNPGGQPNSKQQAMDNARGITNAEDRMAAMIKAKMG